MNYSRTLWNGTYLYQATVDIRTAKFFVTSSHTDLMVPQKTSSIAQRHGLSLCVNGGGFDYKGEMVVSRGLAASGGHTYGRRLERSLFISKKNLITFARHGAIWNAIPYPNQLISDWIPVNYDQALIAPRTFLGWKDEMMTFLVIEGVEGKVGATICQAVQICLDMKFKEAILFDSGGSSAFVLNGELKNLPSDDGIPGHERAVSTHFGVY